MDTTGFIEKCFLALKSSLEVWTRRKDKNKIAKANQVSASQLLKTLDYSVGNKEIMEKQEKITTVGDLRELIRSLGGEMKIGGLKFSYAGGEDIDVNLDDNLIMYWSKSVMDEEGIADAEHFTVMEDIEEGKRAKRENKKLTDELAATKSTINNVGKDSGKVEAYERILFGELRVNITKTN